MGVVMAAFQFEERDGVGVLTFDVPDQKINTFSQHVLRELSDMLGELEKRTDLKGLLFHSGKPGQFIAGADLNELGALVQSSAEDITRGVVVGHELFDRVSRLPFPTVALIDGACMGGGTELILSMDARIASDNPKTKIGLPETKIGLYPAWGGTQRLPRWIGISAAIEMICSGAPIDAAKAVSVGLVFDAVPAESLVDEGTRLLEHLRASEEWTATRERIRRPLGLSDDQMNFTFAVAEAQTRQQTKGHYPAPLAALRCMREGVNRTLDEGLEVERDLAPKVFGSPISAHLIGVFFKTNRVAR
ncbi:MAG: enoyl-CoA hydratase-related protein, partial [Planctomycetales bacterium]